MKDANLQDKSSNEKPLISIVVPVYNVEKYLERCVATLIKQSYPHIEIVLVNDGSKDNSGEICRILSSKNERIKVIEKENGGLSSARNTGIKAASGDYIAFVDSDDWVSLDTYEYLYSLINRSNADIAQISVMQTNDYVEEVPFKKERVKICRNKDILQNYMISSTRNSEYYSVCTCLFKKSVIEGIWFREGKVNEDIDFKYKALMNSSVFIESNIKKYFYFQERESISRGGLKTKDFDLYDTAEELWQLACDENYGTIRKLANVKRARTAFSLLSKIAYYGISDSKINEKETIKKLIKEHRKNLGILLRSPMGIKRKVLAGMYALSFRFSRFLIRFYRRVAS